MSKEGGESSLTYGTSDGTSTASPESSVWTTEESACKKAGKSGRARLPQPQIPGQSPGPHCLCLRNPEYVSGQEDSLKIFKSQVFPQVWESGKVRPCISVIPWQDKGFSNFPRTIRKMVWTPTGSQSSLHPINLGPLREPGWRRAWGNWLGAGRGLPLTMPGPPLLWDWPGTPRLFPGNTEDSSTVCPCAGSEPSPHPLRNLRLTFPTPTAEPFPLGPTAPPSLP